MTKGGNKAYLVIYCWDVEYIPILKEVGTCSGLKRKLGPTPNNFRFLVELLLTLCVKPVLISKTK